MLETTQSQVDETANQPDIGKSGGEMADQNAEPFLTVRYNKEDKPLSREAAVTYAQKGLNYDKLSERLTQTNEKLGEVDGLMGLASEYAQKSGMTTEEVLGLMRQHLDANVDERATKQTEVDKQLEAFMLENPELNPMELPEAVIEEWQKGVSLSKAYYAHQELKEKQLAQQATNQQNANASMGTAQSSGEAHDKVLSPDTIHHMTPRELDKNHSRIWAFLTK